LNPSQAGAPYWRFGCAQSYPPVSDQFAKVATALGKGHVSDSSRSLARFVEPLATGMIREKLDWRLVFQAREYLPG
jgi:hypothetical protein